MACGTAKFAPLLVHPGYHKTGTTWFQRRLFIPAFGYRQILTHQEVFTHLIRPHGLTFDAAAARQLIEERRSPAGSGVVDVISSENLSGSPLHGGRESGQYAERLKQVAPDARVLITVREQVKMLTAIYMQYVFRALTEKPQGFFANDPTIGYHTFAPEHFEYHRLVARYRDLFGADNVFVTNQETLARAPLDLATAIATFAGVTANWDPEGLVVAPEAPSAPEALAPVLRRINHVRSGPARGAPLVDLGPAARSAYRSVAALGRIKPVRDALKDVRPVSAEVQRRYKGYFAASNRELKAMLGESINLKGYEM